MNENIEDDFLLKIQKNDILIAIAISSFAVFLRLIFAEHYFLGYDPVNFAMGSISFSLAETRPHLPGYFLFVKSIKFISLLVNNIHTASLLLNFILTFAAVFFSYLSLCNIFNIKISIILILIIIFNPMIWYYGCVTEIYTFDWFFSALVIFVYFKKNGLYFLFPVLALGTGFRQSSGVLLLPFGLYLLYKQIKKQDINYKYLAYSILSAIVIFAAWFFPMVSNDGGFSGYIAMYSENNPVEKISLIQNWFRMSSLLVYFIVPYILIIIIYIVNINNIKILKDNKFKLFVSITLFPILFFVFGHYSKGYLLLIAFPLIAIIGILIEKGIIKNNVIAITILIEITMFIFIPYHQTNIESLIKPQMRKESIPKLWLDRTFSNYALTRARINFESKKVDKLIQLINKTNSDTVFIDPTLSYYERILQYYFPKKKLFTIYLHDDNALILFSGLDVNSIKKKGFNIKNILVLTRLDFLKKFMNYKSYNIVYESSGFVLIKYKAKFNFIARYQKLFSRVNN